MEGVRKLVKKMKLNLLGGKNVVILASSSKLAAQKVFYSLTTTMLPTIAARL